MNNIKGSSEEQSIGYPRQLEPTVMSKSASAGFPSCLHIFEMLFCAFYTNSYWRIALNHSDFARLISTDSSSVAFV